jgi:hypothetical protein
MKRVFLSSLAAVGATAAVLAVPAPAHAWPDPNSVYPHFTPTRTAFMYTVGTGSLRAWQYCETPSGQTNWYSYGPWVGKNIWSWTGTCTIIRNRGFDTRNF